MASTQVGSPSLSRVSTNGSGVQGNFTSGQTRSAISGDGTLIAFDSQATDLVPGDLNGIRDIFVKNRVSEEIERISISTSNVEANGANQWPAMSSDGRFVAFRSSATSLGITPGAGILLRDLQANSLSVVPSPAGGGIPDISDDGRFVIWTSAGGTPTYLTDRQSGSVSLVSILTNDGAVLSNSGNSIVFMAFDGAGAVTDDTNGFQDVFVLQRAPETPPDITAPTASPTQTPPTNAAGWNNADVTVTWNWADNAGGTGIDNTSCATVSGSTTEGDSVMLSETCKDLAGNTGSATHPLKVDKTLPTITPAVAPNANLAGWFNTPVAVTFDCADGLSGIAGCSAPSTLSSEGAGQSIIGVAVDAADNSSSATLVGINIDLTAPTVSAPTFSPIPVGSTTPVSVSAADSLSGVAGGEIYVGADPGAGLGSSMTLEGTTLSSSIGSNLMPGVYPVGVRSVDAAAELE